jgi:hypothetical protein
MTSAALPNRLGVHALVWTGSWDETELNQRLRTLAPHRL